MPSGPRVPLPPGLEAAPFTIGQGRSLGMSDKRLRGRDLTAPFRGVRRVAAAPAVAPAVATQDAFVERCIALELLLPDDAYFCAITAARLWPLPLPAATPDEPLHVTVPAPRRAIRRAGVVGHTEYRTDGRVVLREGRRVPDGASIFLQLAPTLSLPDLVAVGDALVLTPVGVDPWWSDRPWVPLDKLRDRVGSFRGRGKRRAAAAVDLVRPGAESRPETLLRLRLLAAGLPEPEVNTVICDSTGRSFARGDLVYRPYRVVVEYDGDHHRTNTRQYDRDLNRMDDLAAAGWRLVRVSARSFFSEPDRVVARVERALRSAGWAP